MPTSASCAESCSLLAMAELPESRKGLKALAKRGVSAASRARALVAERKEGRNELIGAFAVLPMVRDFAPMLPMVNSLGIDARLRDAGVSYVIAMFTKGDISEAFWGSTIGAVGAYSYSQKALLGGLLGGNGNGNGG